MSGTFGGGSGREVSPSGRLGQLAVVAGLDLTPEMRASAQAAAERMVLVSGINPQGALISGFIAQDEAAADKYIAEHCLAPATKRYYDGHTREALAVAVYPLPARGRTELETSALINGRRVTFSKVLRGVHNEQAALDRAGVDLSAWMAFHKVHTKLGEPYLSNVHVEGSTLDMTITCEMQDTRQHLPRRYALVGGLLQTMQEHYKKLVAELRSAPAFNKLTDDGKKEGQSQGQEPAQDH